MKLLLATVALLLHNLVQARINGDFQSLKKLIPSQSCYYQAYNKCLTCNCDNTETSATLDFELGYYVINSGDDIREVRVAQCQELRVRLDLRGVDATNVPIHFRSIGRLDFESISFEPSYSHYQELELNFHNVERLHFNEINVQDTLKIRAMNVKEVKIVNSTFAHIPTRGVQVSRAKLVDISGSTFSRISRRSIVVEKIKEVMVIDNQMTVNALEVVYAKDGSHLMISCNRLLNQRVSTDCSQTTTTTTTTTTTATTTRRTVVLSPGYSDSIVKDNGKETNDGGHLPEIIGGVIGGLLIITIVLLVLILRKKREADGSKANGIEAAKVTSENGFEKVEEAPAPVGTEAGEEPKETDSLLGSDDEDDRPKFASPIWLEEIQKNKIFNRQKSLLSEDKLAELAAEVPEQCKPEVPDAQSPEPPPPCPPAEDVEMKQLQSLPEQDVPDVEVKEPDEVLEDQKQDEIAI